MPLGVDALLIVAAIGSAVDDALAALGRLQLSLRDEPAALLADALKQNRGWFIVRILRHQLSLYCHLQNRVLEILTLHPEPLPRHLPAEA